MGTHRGEEVFDLLTFEGYPLEAITAAIDAVVRGGLELIQGDKGPLLTDGEVARLRAALRGNPDDGARSPSRRA